MKCAGVEQAKQQVPDMAGGVGAAKSKVTQRQKRRAEVHSSAQASTKLGSGEFFGKSSEVCWHNDLCG